MILMLFLFHCGLTSRWRPRHQVTEVNSNNWYGTRFSNPVCVRSSSACDARPAPASVWFVQSLVSHTLLWSGLLRKSAPRHRCSLLGFSSELLGAFLLLHRRRALLADLPLDGRNIEGARGGATPTTVAAPRPGHRHPLLLAEALPASAP